MTLNTAGKVTASDWRDFQVRFCEIWHDVPEANEDEAYQILLENCQLSLHPGGLKNRKKRKFKSPKVMLGPMPGYETDEDSLIVETRLGQRPHRTEKRGNQHLSFSSQRKNTYKNVVSEW